MVLVDCNGLDKGPNKYWEKDKPSDRFYFYLNYTNGRLDGARPSAEIKDVFSEKNRNFIVMKGVQ